MSNEAFKTRNPKSMAYIAQWDSFTNMAVQHYLPIEIPELTLPGNGTPAVFRSQIGQNVHEAVCAHNEEDPKDWEVISCLEPVPYLFAVTMINKDRSEISTYSVRFAP